MVIRVGQKGDGAFRANRPTITQGRRGTLRRTLRITANVSNAAQKGVPAGSRKCMVTVLSVASADIA
jgi:hypothetical protein